MPLGLLVHGDNHFIVSGPAPTWEQALALARHWSVIQIGAPALSRWEISSRAFREDLEWAVVVPGEGECNPAVAQLLSEVAGRGLRIVRGP